jgi:uncharacterized surface protein with fasciclin (FAS1) repeats
VLASGSYTITITTLKTRTFTIAGIVITDEENRNIVAFDVQESNGIMHVVDNVLLPTL